MVIAIPLYVVAVIGIFWFLYYFGPGLIYLTVYAWWVFPLVEKWRESILRRLHTYTVEGSGPTKEFHTSQPPPPEETKRTSRETEHIQSSAKDRLRQSGNKVVGIDLGTTKSAIAIMDSGSPFVIPAVDGSPTIPSLVLFTRDQKILAGYHAARHPDRYHGKNVLAQSFKRMMGKGRTDVWGYLKSPPEEVSAFVLHELKRQAEEFLGTTVSKVVIAVPAHFDVNQRQAVEDAALIAGLDPIWLLNEATAAGLAFAHRRKGRRDMKLLIFDLGGGTLDVSIIDFGGGVIEVMSIEGDSTLGGLDFDQVIADYILETIGREIGSKPSLDSFQRLVLMEAAERAKTDLTTAPAASIFIPGFLQVGGVARDLALSIERGEFERRSKNLIDRMMVIVSTALKDAAIEPGNLGAFLLVGNASQMPMIRNRIKENLNIEPVSGGDPKLCVAEGAAIYASVLTGETKDTLLLDVMNGSCGIGLEGDRYEVLIEKNTTTPVEKSRVFTTTRDNQDRISVPVYQGNYPVASKNTFLGTLELKGIPPAAAGVPQIRVRFSVNAKMILWCSAKDLGTQVEQTIAVRPPHALTPTNLKSKIERFNALRSV